MGALNYLKTAILSAAIFLASGCSATKLYYPPERMYVAPKHEDVIRVYSEEGDTPKGGRLEERIKLDTYQIANKFRTRLTEEVVDRINLDLQESRVRLGSYVYDQATYDLFVRQTFRHQDPFQINPAEQEFKKYFFNEIRRLSIKALRDSLKDLFVYQNVKPFFEFNLREDKIPFTDKSLGDLKTDSVEEKKVEPAREVVSLPTSIDDFDERILNPHKLQRDEPISSQWFYKKLTSATVGLNVNFDIPKSGDDFGLEPYLKWLDAIRWTYSTRDHTIEHKLSFPIYNVGLGFSARTDELVRDIHKVDLAFTHVFNVFDPERKTGALRIGVYQVFDVDKHDDKNKDDQGITFNVFVKF